MKKVFIRFSIIVFFFSQKFYLNGLLISILRTFINISKNNNNNNNNEDKGNNLQCDKRVFMQHSKSKRRILSPPIKSSDSF